MDRRWQGRREDRKRRVGLRGRAQKIKFASGQPRCWKIGRTHCTPQLFLQLFFPPSSGWMGRTIASSSVVFSLSWSQVSSDAATQSWMLPLPFYAISIMRSPCVPGLGGVPFWYPPQHPARMLLEQSMYCVNSLFSHLSSPTDCGLHRGRLMMALLCIPMYTECPACSRCLT